MSDNKNIPIISDRQIAVDVLEQELRQTLGAYVDARYVSFVCKWKHMLYAVLRVHLKKLADLDKVR